MALKEDLDRLMRKKPGRVVAIHEDDAREIVRDAIAPVTARISELEAALPQVTAERDEARKEASDLQNDWADEVAASRQKTERADAAEASLATATSELAQLRAEGEAKDRRIAALEAALAPFAKAGGLFGPRQSNGWDVLIYSPAAGDEYCITADHLRAARAATAREG